MKPLLSDYRYSAHDARFIRRQLGCAPISSRPLYGYSVRCQCGWEMKTNESKGVVERLWREHTRSEWQKEFGA